MARLVNDLLMLAKTRRPDFVTLRPEDVHLLTTELFHKARALGPRQWSQDDVATGTVAVDRQRLTQAMMQLVENAVRHTKETDTIAIGSRWTATGLEFWVRDSGPGVAEADRELIFHRFHRGAGRQTTDPGFGLGLSIVAAIAEAHGGRIDLDDTKRGATFRLILPQNERKGRPA